MDSGRISLPRAARNPKEVPMFRKTVLGLGAALILTAAVAPTAAFAGGGHHGGVTASRIRLAVPVAAGLPAARQHTGRLGTAVTVQPS